MNNYLVNWTIHTYVLHKKLLPLPTYCNKHNLNTKKMKKLCLIVMLVALVCPNIEGKKQADCFPDGTPIPKWFSDSTRVQLSEMGKAYTITDYGVKNDSNLIQTNAIQAVINKCHAEGGGVVVVPKGTFLTGSLFFKPGVNLYLSEYATLKGSDAISHYKIVKTRLEGQTLDYFAALINADHANGFCIAGKGTINGNGIRFYDEFWLRRKVNKKCTNLEALRPRMVYISNSSNVKVCDVNMINSGFWTNHLYKCDKVKFLGCHIYAPTDGYPKGPSTDAIDLDACSNVLVSGCWINVNDDGICLKGGKGTFVDRDSTNGACTNIIVENCQFKKAGGGITFGSECYDASNVIIRNSHFDGTSNILLFKMRPDTPQKYRNVLAENCTGETRHGIRTRVWTQFYDKKERTDMPRSYIDNITARNLNVRCTVGFYCLSPSQDYDLRNFAFENIKAEDPKGEMDTSFLQSCTIKNVRINGKTITDIQRKKQ